MDNIRVDCNEYYFLARRADRSWGNAIDITIYSLEGQKLGSLLFCCHPEFDEFELYQSYKTNELIEIAAKRIEKDFFTDRYKEAWDMGINVLLRFNSPNAKFPNINA